MPRPLSNSLPAVPHATAKKAEGKGCSASSDTKDATAASSFTLRGSVTSAFAVQVNKDSFPDLESFFTAEVGRLSAKAKAAGYDGYDAKFDAQIGFNDLAVGLTVYVAPATNRGYQGKTIVAGDGTFALEFPAAASGDTYQIKANKRIAVILTNQADKTNIKKFCYNFAATDLQVPYSDKDKPIVLSSFISTLTAYECATDPGVGSLAIPANSSSPTVVSTTTGASTPATDPTLSAHDQSIISAMQALTAPAATDDLIFIPSTSSTPLVRAHDKTLISKLDALMLGTSALVSLGGSSVNYSFSTYAGLPYIVAHGASGSSPSIQVGDSVYFSGPLNGLGFDTADIQRIFTVELVPDDSSFVVRASKSATASGQITPTSIQAEHAIKITPSLKTRVWATADGASTVLLSSPSGSGFIVDASGKLCWDSASTAATFGSITSGGATIVCK